MMVILLFTGFASTAYAVMYQYVDEKGTVILTSDKESIPEQFRDSIEEVKEPATPDGFSPEGRLADEIRERRQKGDTEGQTESSDARWYKENPDIEPSDLKRPVLRVKDLWDKVPFERSWPIIAASLGFIAAFVVSRFIISQSQRRLIVFFSFLTALTFLLVMYTLVLK